MLTNFTQTVLIMAEGHIATDWKHIPHSILNRYTPDTVTSRIMKKSLASNPILNPTAAPSGSHKAHHRHHTLNQQGGIRVKLQG